MFRRDTWQSVTLPRARRPFHDDAIFEETTLESWNINYTEEDNILPLDRSRVPTRTAAMMDHHGYHGIHHAIGFVLHAVLPETTPESSDWLAALRRAEGDHDAYILSPSHKAELSIIPHFEFELDKVALLIYTNRPAFCRFENVDDVMLAIEGFDWQ